MCVICVYAGTCVWRPQVNIGYHSLGAVYLLSEPRSVSGTWDASTSKPQWSTCLCLPRSRITSACSHGWLLTWGLGIKLVYILVQHISYWLGYVLSPVVLLLSSSLFIIQWEKVSLYSPGRSGAHSPPALLSLSRDEIIGMDHHPWILSSVFHTKKQSSKIITLFPYHNCTTGWLSSFY